MKKILKKIPNKHQVIIVENSLDKKIKKNIESNFKNSKVFIPKENLGYAAAFNFGFKKCDNNFVLTLTPDVNISKDFLIKLVKIVSSFKNFTLLAPEYKNQKVYKNYEPINGSKKNFYFKNHKLVRVKEIDWCMCLINKSKIKKRNILDENFFLYFETTDLNLRLINNKHKLYVIKQLKFDHLGTSSSNEKYRFEIQFNRNWHYSWSKFYFYQKNYNYFFALKKILPNLSQGILGLLFSALKFNYSHIKLHSASLSGAINAIFLRSSYFRPNIK